jgi:hypothetical protein
MVAQSSLVHVSGMIMISKGKKRGVRSLHGICFCTFSDWVADRQSWWVIHGGQKSIDRSRTPRTAWSGGAKGTACQAREMAEAVDPSGYSRAGLLSLVAQSLPCNCLLFFKQGGRLVVGQKHSKGASNKYDNLMP